MSDNSFDKDNPLKQVLQLCSTLAGKGCEFSISVRIKDSFSFSLKSGKPQDKKGKKRSPSFYRRQERRKLLKKKNKDCSLEQPLETPESKQKDTCSLDLNPHPDSGLSCVPHRPPCAPCRRHRSHQLCSHSVWPPCCYHVFFTNFWILDWTLFPVIVNTF